MAKNVRRPQTGRDAVNRYRKLDEAEAKATELEPALSDGPFSSTLQVGVAAQVQVWQGQFPHPDTIERYEAVLPGAFDRIISMAEKQQTAVIESAAEARQLHQRDTRRGQVLGFAVTLVAILAAVVCAYLKANTVALVLVAVPWPSPWHSLADVKTDQMLAASLHRRNRHPMRLEP